MFNKNWLEEGYWIYLEEYRSMNSRSLKLKNGIEKISI